MKKESLYILFPRRIGLLPGRAIPTALPSRLCRALCILPLLVATSLSYAASTPKLSETALYTVGVSGCVQVDLKNWKHETRALLEQRNTQVLMVQLCNDRKYPVYYVKFPYDYRGSTEKYFMPLFSDMLKANGGWPLSFVDFESEIVLSIKYGQKPRVSVDAEEFAK